MPVLASDFMGRKVHEAAAAYDRVLARAATWRAERLAATTTLLQQEASYAARLEAEPDSDAAARASWRGELGLAALETEIRDLDTLLQKHPAAQAKGLAAWQQAQEAERLAFIERADALVREIVEPLLPSYAQFAGALERLRPIVGLSRQWAEAQRGNPFNGKQPHKIPLEQHVASLPAFAGYLSFQFGDQLAALQASGRRNGGRG